MNKLTYYIITLLFPLSLVTAEVSVNQYRPVDFSFQQTSSSVMTLKIALDDILLKTVEFDGEFFTDAQIEGLNSYHIVGAPQLPFIRKMIKIPANSKIEYEITVQSEETMALTQIGFPDPLLPVRPYRRKTADGRTPVVTDDKIYSKDAYYSPGPVQINAPVKIGEVTGVMLDFFPVSYNPVSHSLKIISSAVITVKITTAPALQKVTEKSLRRHPELDRLAREIFINYAASEPAAKGAEPLNFLVIAGDRFAESAELGAYLNWKRQCGFDITLKSVSELGGTTGSIRDYIVNQYNSGSAPVYILLVGDVADVPVWTGSVGETETDAPYGRMDSDFIPDILVGRFSAADENDLVAMIRKSMAYEQCNTGNMAAFNKIMFIATDDADYWELAEASHDYIIDTYLNDRGVYTDHIKGHSAGNAADIAQALNDGRTICHYSGHGSESQWQGPEFTIYNITELGVGSAPALVISNACETGSYSEAECFGEAWIRVNDRGAFAFIGASNSSYWEPDDIMERSMYDGYFEDGGISVGAMVYKGLFDVYTTSHTAGDEWTYKYYYDIYNILGDPSIKPRIGLPQATYVDYNPIIYLNATDYAVSVMNESGAVENATVTLVQNENIVAYGITGVDGSVTLMLEPETLQLGNLLLTVTGEGQAPTIDTLRVTNSWNVALEPASVPVGGIADISIRVLDDSSKAVQDAEIYVAGWTVRGDSLLGYSNADGVLQFRLRPKYGEEIRIEGKISAEPELAFTETLPVTGAESLSNPAIRVGVSQFNVENFLIPGYIGQIGGSAVESDVLLAVAGCGIDTVASLADLQVLPDTVGTAAVALLKPGYEVFERTVIVGKAFGSVAGVIANTGQQPLAGASIAGYLYPDTVHPVFNVISNVVGEFACPLPVEVGYYRIRAQRFGYQTATIVDTVKAGTNTIMIELVDSPRVPVSGRITGSVSAQPLDAIIKVEEFSSGTAVYFTSVQTFAAADGRYDVELPPGDYRFTVSATRYISGVFQVNVGGESLEINFNLDPARAAILLIDDDSGKRSVDKNSAFTITEEEGKSSSAVEIQNMLESFGYYVKKVFASSLSDDLGEFDMVISSSGANIDPVASGAYRSLLENYVAAGGKLLIEGGEVGYDATTDPGYPTFTQNVLHVSKWSEDQAGPLYRLLENHELTTVPNTLPFQLDIDYGDYGDEDACTPATDARIVYFNNGSSAYGGIILYEDPDNSCGSRVVFYTFAFDKLADQAAREQLLENTIEYLLRKPDYIKGDVNRDGQIDILDLRNLVNLILQIESPEDDSEIWAADLNGDNAINVLDLVGIINIILGRDGFAKPVGAEDGVIRLNLQGRRLLYDSNLPITALQIEFEPGCVFTAADEIINDEAVSIKQANNIMLLYSFGDAVVLSGGGSLGTFDNVGKIAGAVAADRTGRQVFTSVNVLPDRFDLYPNYPNPFNSQTVIEYAIPEKSGVTVEIYDLRGYKVRILVAGLHEAHYYRRLWDGRDDDGRLVASGLYFLRIAAVGETRTFIKTQKMVMVR